MQSSELASIRKVIKKLHLKFMKKQRLKTFRGKRVLGEKLD